MSELITAKEAKKLAELYEHKQAADKLVADVATRIKAEAMRGREYLSVDDMNWGNDYNDKYVLAKQMLLDAGYTVARYEYEYAPNGGRPDKFKAVKISW